MSKKEELTPIASLPGT